MTERNHGIAADGMMMDWTALASKFAFIIIISCPIETKGESNR